MKKILSIIIVLILTFILFCIPASAAGTGTLALSTAEGKPGDTVTVSVNLNSNPGLITMRFTVSWGDGLALTSVSNTGLLAGWTTPVPTISSPYTLRWADSLATKNNTATGEIATLTFKIKDNATVGNKTVTLTFNESRNTNGGKNTFGNTTATIKVNCKTHTYDSSCDTSCNICGATRTITHKFGTYVYNNDATASKDGTKTRTCSGCGKTETVTAEGTRLEPELIDSSKKFTDVPKNQWYKQYVDYAVTHGIFNGTSAKNFSPNLDMTRAQVVMVFANISGINVSNNNISSGFTDVKKGEWYTAAVAWAARNGIVNGVGNGRFDPNAKVTREQMCVMIVNYIENYRGETLNQQLSSFKFADDSKISSWAKAAVYKCARAKLVNGVGNNKFDPKATATRAQGATLFSTLHKEYIK